VFARPRVILTLPLGLAIEASYIPPIQVGDAHPHLGSAAISETVPLSGFGPFGSSALMLRAHGTIGHVNGPITCPESSLQQTNPDDPCYGNRPSDDTFKPNMYGVEGVYGVSSRGGRFDFFAGTGVTWLRPRFEVGFTDLNGFTDNTQVDRPGTRIMVGRGSAYDLFLSRELKAAQLLRTPTSQTVVDRFLAENADVAAGVRQQLESDAVRLGGLRLLPGRFMVIEQAMGLPLTRGVTATATLATFVEQAKASGYVAQSLARHGIRGAVVAPASG